ncbi:MAG TPA: hypothetical protein VLZ03_01345, partial [Thermodesulfobacteriota bacterium]|nr:hypothetical protein [Thermodesulfobacteriota bacterium]
MSLFLEGACLLAFGIACWAGGDLLRKLLFNEPLPAFARHTLAFAVGNVGYSYLLTGLGFGGLYSPAILRIVLFSGIGLALWRIIEEGKSVFYRLARRRLEYGKGSHLSPDNRAIGKDPGILTAQAEIRENDNGWSIHLLWLFAVVVVFLIPAILQAAAPPYARDSLVYHLLCPKEYLKAGRIVHIQGNLFSAFPKGHEVLMTLLLSNGGDRAAQGFSILQQVAAIGELYSLTYMMAGPLPAALCTVGYATVPPVMYFTGCAYVEPALLMTLGGCLLVLVLSLQHGRGTNRTRRIGLGPVSLLGFLAGWLLALKYSGLIYLGLIGLILLWNQRRVLPKKALRIIGVFSLSAAPGLCWMGWNWINLGNPVYPMAWFLFGGKGWDEARALAMSQYFDVYGMGRNPSDYFLLPWRLAFEGRFDTIRFDGAIGPFLILGVVMAVASTVLLVRRQSVRKKLGEIGLMLIVSAAFFVFGTQQVRFWLPSQMLVCAFAAPSAEFLVNWAKGRSSIRIVLFFVLISSFAWNVWFLGQQFFKVGFYRPVLGMEQEKDFLIRRVPGFPALEFINQNLPSSSYLFCVWTGAYGYYIGRRYYS